MADTSGLLGIVSRSTNNIEILRVQKTITNTDMVYRETIRLGLGGRIMKRYYIVAGNYEQYHAWIKERGLSPKEWVYVSGRDTVRGVRNPEGRFIGTWYQRDDAFDILTVLGVATDVKNENLEKALVMWIELQDKKVVSAI